MSEYLYIVKEFGMINWNYISNVVAAFSDYDEAVEFLNYAAKHDMLYNEESHGLRIVEAGYNGDDKFVRRLGIDGNFHYFQMEKHAVDSRNRKYCIGYSSDHVIVVYETGYDNSKHDILLVTYSLAQAIGFKSGAAVTRIQVDKQPDPDRFKEPEPETDIRSISDDTYAIIMTYVSDDPMDANLVCKNRVIDIRHDESDALEFCRRVISDDKLEWFIDGAKITEYPWRTIISDSGDKYWKLDVRKANVVDGKVVGWHI